MKVKLGGVVIAVGLSITASGLDHLVTSWSAQGHPLAIPTGAFSAFTLPSGFVAQLTIPRLGTTLYVVQAKSSRDLRRGPGIISGSTAPGGSNCIIAGHRDLHFRVLRDIRAGDEIELLDQRGRFRYRVASFQIVSPTDDTALRPRYANQLTLVTCYPFYYLGPAPRRLIVRARLVAGAQTQ